MKKLAFQALGLATVLASIGCADPNKLVPPPPGFARTSSVMTQGLAFKPKADAGADITKDIPKPGGKLWTALTIGHPFSNRPDPFALESKERGFDISQSTERVFGDIGYYQPVFVPKDDTVPQPEIEPQPYRRL